MKTMTLEELMANYSQPALAMGWEDSYYEPRDDEDDYEDYEDYDDYEED